MSKLDIRLLLQRYRIHSSHRPGEVIPDSCDGECEPDFRMEDFLFVLVFIISSYFSRFPLFSIGFYMA